MSLRRDITNYLNQENKELNRLLVKDPYQKDSFIIKTQPSGWTVGFISETLLVDTLVNIHKKMPHELHKKLKKELFDKKIVDQVIHFLSDKLCQNFMDGTMICDGLAIVDRTLVSVNSAEFKKIQDRNTFAPIYNDCGLKDEMVKNNLREVKHELGKKRTPSTLSNCSTISESETLHTQITKFAEVLGLFKKDVKTDLFTEQAPYVVDHFKVMNQIKARGQRG